MGANRISFSEIQEKIGSRFPRSEPVGSKCGGMVANPKIAAGITLISNPGSALGRNAWRRFTIFNQGLLPPNSRFRAELLSTEGFVLCGGRGGARGLADGLTSMRSVAWLSSSSTPRGLASRNFDFSTRRPPGHCARRRSTSTAGRYVCAGKEAPTVALSRRCATSNAVASVGKPLTRLEQLVLIGSCTNGAPLQWPCM